VLLVQSITSPKVNVPEGPLEPSHLTGQNSSKSSEEFQQLLSGLPDEGLGSEGFSNAVSLLSENSVNNSSPGFLGKLVSAPSPPGTAADLFLSIFNNNGHVWRASPALTAVEKHVSGELARLFGLKGPHAGGVTVPGGAAGNMLALLVARNIVLPESKQHGVTLGKYAVFVSDAAHYSVTNAAQIVGLGNGAVTSVPALEDGTMDVDALEAAVDAAIQSGKQPLFINATAGNTVNGAFDPIDKIAAIASKANAWFHIDACWGGAVAFSDNLRYLIKGSERADSIAFNPHKMLGVPLVCAFLLTNDLRTFWLANKLNAGYLFHDKAAGKPATSQNGTNGHSKENDWRDSKLLDDAPEVADIRDLASLTVQCSRRSDATKLFLHWIYYGTRGIAREVEQAVDSAQHLASLVQAHPRLELVGDTENVFAQVCFYWSSKEEENGTADGAHTAAVNSHNTHVLYKHLTAHGWKIDYAPHKVKGDFIRIACNRLTTRRGVEGLLTKLVELGESLGL
jgi:glutamate decarboxylase